MKYPFEASYAEIQADPEDFVSTRSSLASPGGALVFAVKT